ncbi:MAG TPA: carboxypeptidase regulatory-like domain-containing protein [Bryobacteraceae bacterium]|nr:carboxypeptidase regulatory-like domain-containing protein [Bryobacteraceae bacterium]
MHVRLLLPSLFVCMTAVYAADPTGKIAGTVLDPSGAAVVDAKITATAVATGLTRTASSGGDGGYVFPLLPVGIYNVSVVASGFRTFEQKGVEVRTDQSVTVPIVLQIGAASESVTVEANAQLVETRSGTLSEVVGQQRIIELPLNGRNAAALVLLSPGTVDTTAGNARGSGDTQQTATYPGAQSISSNGARADNVNYNLDGGSNQDHYTNVNNPFPNPDAVEEFSVQTNSYSAEYGRGAGGIVNVVTKSGTNELHGSAFEFLRNGDLNARNFFANNHDFLKRNQYGGSLGGPIKKDRLFFFGTYQGTILRNVSLGNTATVLTNAQRNGDFSSLSKQLVDPVTKQPIPGNIIPASRIDPVTAKLLPYIPTSPRSDAFINYDRPVDDTENQFMGRVDYNLSKQRFYGRYLYSGYTRDPVVGKPDLVASARGFTDRDQSVSVSHTYNFSPSLLNSAIFSYNRINGTIISGAPFSWTDLGIPIASSTPPELTLSVAGYFSVGTGHPGEFNRQNFHFTDSVHWIRGGHEIAIGGDIMKMQVDLINTYRQNANYRFRGAGYSGDPRADFMLGWADRFIQGGGEYAARRGTLGSLFIQDNYRVTPSLVLNLGLRWDPFHPYSDTLGRTECYRPGLTSQRFPNAPLGYLYEGDPGCPSGGSQPAYWNFAPRVGFAYNAGGKSNTTIRGGWGMFYQPPFVEAYNNMVDSAPWSPQVQRFGVPFDDPYKGYPQNPFPAQYAPFVPPSSVQFIKPPSLAVSYTPDWRPARTMAWNLTVERQLHTDLLVRLGYAGGKGTHLGYNSDVNAPMSAPNATADNEQDRRPNQNFQEVVQDISGGNSIYNSLQVSMEKRFSHGFTVNANYTFAKAIDQVSYLTDLCGVNVINPYNVGAYRAVSDFNVPHRFVLNYLWQLPSPSHGVARALFGGWQTTGIWSWQSGFPLLFTSNDDRSLTAVGNDLADVVGQPSLTSGSRGQKIAQWFTTSAFASAKLGTFGNVGRNILSGPGTFNIDFAAHKVFTLKERWKLQYRAEFFNVLNHTLLNNPDTGVPDGNFGRITSARDPRIIQMALKLIF